MSMSMSMSMLGSGSGLANRDVAWSSHIAILRCRWATTPNKLCPDFHCSGHYRVSTGNCCG